MWPNEWTPGEVAARARREEANDETVAAREPRAAGAAPPGGGARRRSLSPAAARVARAFHQVSVDLPSADPAPGFADAERARACRARERAASGRRASSTPLARLLPGALAGIHERDGRNDEERCDEKRRCDEHRKRGSPAALRGGQRRERAFSPRPSLARNRGRGAGCCTAFPGHRGGLARKGHRGLRGCAVDSSRSLGRFPGRAAARGRNVGATLRRRRARRVDAVAAVEAICYEPRRRRSRAARRA